MRWVPAARRARSSFTGVLAGLILAMVAADPAPALDLRMTGRADYTSSDNVERAPAGSEAEGNILTETVGLGLTEKWGPNSVDLLIEGGWETVEGETGYTEEVNRMRLDARFPRSSGGALALFAESSRETILPDPEELDQERLLTERTRAGVDLNGLRSSGSSWSAGLSGRTEKREDRDLLEFGVDVEWEKPFARARSLVLGLGRTDGEDEATGRSWEEQDLSLSYRRQISRTSSLDYSLQWSGSLVDEAGTGGGRSGRVGARVTLREQSSPRWNHVYSAGAEQVTTVENGTFTEPAAQVSIVGDLSRVTRFDAVAAYATRLPDPLADQATWSRNGSLRAGLSWTALPGLSVQPSVSWQRSELLGEETEGRDDVAVIQRLQVTWRPGTQWSLNMTLLSEERNSTDDLYDLTENRVGLDFSGTFD